MYFCNSNPTNEQPYPTTLFFFKPSEIISIFSNALARQNEFAFGTAIGSHWLPSQAALGPVYPLRS